MERTNLTTLTQYENLIVGTILTMFGVFGVSYMAWLHYFKEWSLIHKILLFSYAPLVQAGIWLYAKYWMPSVNTDNGFEVFFGMLLGYSPFILVPLWGFSLFLLSLSAKESERGGRQRK